MTIAFSKMHGAGNDFVVIDHREPSLPAQRGALFARLCDRRRGVGADGVLLLERAADADFTMRYYNADGGAADFCGNGARCLARFALELGLGRDGNVTFVTAAGRKRARRLADGRIALAFGPVGAARPVTLSAAGQEFAGVCIDAGVPHLVVPHAEPARVPLAGWASALRRHPELGPDGANVDFVGLLADGRVAMRTWERGVEGETLACGSGAIATAAWAVDAGVAASPVTVRTAGGDDLVVEFELEQGVRAATLTGPATVVFTGQWQE